MNAKARGVRTGSIVTNTEPLDYGTFGRTAKVLAIVDRYFVDQVVGEKHYEKMAIVKLHYNGQLYIVPEKSLRKATNEEKKKDPRNTTYWKNAGTSLNLSKVFYVERETSFVG